MKIGNHDLTKKCFIIAELSANHNGSLETAIETIRAAKRTGARVVGHIPLPTKRELYTVLSSPHVDKKAREQFETRTHIRLLDILNPTIDTIDKLKVLPIAAGVDIKIKA